MKFIAAQFYWQSVKGPFTINDIVMFAIGTPIIMLLIFFLAYMWQKIEEGNKHDSGDPRM